MRTPQTLLELALLSFLVVALVRAIHGPTLADRVIVAQLFGTTCVTLLLLESAVRDAAGLRDVALMFAILSPLTVAAFVRLAPYRRRNGRTGAG